MTTKSLLEELHKQHAALEAAINLIESLITNGSHVKKQAGLMQSIRHYKKNRKLIARAPWNKGIKTGPRKKAAKKHNGHKWSPQQRERFLKTMKERYGKKTKSE